MIHKLADVQSEYVGQNTKIWQFCVVLPNAKIGENCNLEDYVFIGPNVTFTNDFLPRSKQYPKQFLKTIVKKYASIGANATIIGGITIGEYAMIGAGSVITKNIKSHSLVYGNPAKQQVWVCECGNKLQNTNVENQYQCDSCEKTFNLI